MELKVAGIEPPFERGGVYEGIGYIAIEKLVFFLGTGGCPRTGLDGINGARCVDCPNVDRIYIAWA